MLRSKMPVVLLGLLTLAGCTDSPISPELQPRSDALADLGFGPSKTGKTVARANVLTEIPIQIGPELDGWLSITELSVEEGVDGRQLLADVVVSWLDEDDIYNAEAFEDQPIEISRAESTASVVSSFGPSFARAPSESGVCDILYLTLGPLDLDLLGLTVELSNIELDLDAVPGAGNLLGNLLCAVTGLLDGGPLAALLNLIGSINDILDGINDFLSNLSALGSLISPSLVSAGPELAIGGGPSGFTGTLSVTQLSWDETGETLLVDGVLNGRVKDGGKTTQVRDLVISDVPATLTTGTSSALSPMISAARAPSEPGICDVLYLDLAPTFLDLLGLTVDLSPIELDIDAVPGGGNLLGNLLCAVTGLLDGAAGGGLGGLLQSLLQGLLDVVNQLLGGLSL